MDSLIKIVKMSNCTKYGRKLLQSYKNSKVFDAGTRKLSQQSWTQKLSLMQAENIPKIPAYRVMDENGNVLDPSQEPQLEDSLLIDLYKGMVKLNVMERILYESQRQGRISFYMTSFGEEATQFGSAAALSDSDVVYGQYRETGILMWRGYNIETIVDQCFGNDNDVAKGKQMPLHYGSKALNFVTISSPLSTQMPQAVGSAYACKLAKEGKCVAVYFGEGAASEGDAHAALNFAAVLQTPTIFVCRNNGYAISTPTYEQYRGDGIAAKGPAYGIATTRVDGNDLLAVYNATKKARQFAVDKNKPVLIEALTYRLSHHSTSDDSTAYRSEEEVSLWRKRNNPVTRFRNYLKNKQLWNDKEQEEHEKKIRSQVVQALQAAEKTIKPAWTEMFTDVYLKMPASLDNQKKSMGLHLQRFAENYSLQSYKNVE